MNNLSPGHSTPHRFPARPRPLKVIRVVAGLSLVIAILADSRLGAADPSTAQAAPSATTGTVAGRVQDGTTRQFLLNARVQVVGTQREVFTDVAGNFQIADVPAGPITLRVFFTGQQPQSADLEVAAGAVTSHDFVLQGVFERPSETGSKDIVLDKFVVDAKRSQNAAEIAINEQRYSSNIKTVVSTEAFGDLAQNNIGEFLKYIPGVESVYGDSSIGGVQLRGMPANQTNISIDGGGVNVAGSGNSSRSLNFQTISLNNVSRIEVSKSVLADQRADSLGGTINLVSRSAFEQNGARLDYKAFLNLNSHFTDLEKTPGGKIGGDGKRYKWFPDFELNYVSPLTPNLGIAFNATRNDQFTLTRRFTKGYSLTNTTVDAPYLQAFTLLNYPTFEERTTAGLKIDWRVTPHDVVSFSGNVNYYFSNFEQHNFQFQANTLSAAPATGRTAATGDFGPSFTLGRPGQGTVQQFYVTTYGAQANDVFRVTYRHTGTDWDIDAGGGGNKSWLWYRNANYGQFQVPRVQLTGVTIRFDEINDFGPRKISITNGNTTTRPLPLGTPIDYNVLSNYNAIGFNGSNYPDRAQRVNARDFTLNARRKFTVAGNPASLKVGAAFRSDARDRQVYSFTPAYVGPAGAGAGVAALPAGAVQDTSGFSQYNLLGGYQAPEWLSSRKVYGLFQSHPEYFTYTVANQATDYTNHVDATEELRERITAGYLMGDISLWRGRLRLVGGVRFERWDFDGRGQLVDLTRQYQKDANGKLLKNSNNQLIPLTTDPLEVAKLTHLEMGNRMSRSNHRFYPSFGTTLNLTENMVLRLGYAKTTGRPEFSNLIPGLNVNRVVNAADDATGSGLGTINAKNPNLKAWIADNFDVSAEYYTKTGGVFSVAVFRKNITDFFSAVQTIATTDYLDSVGLPQDYLNYLVITPGNVKGITHMTGIELSAQQKLTRSLSVFANASINRNIGPADADFRGYTPKRINVGATYGWRRYTATIKFYHIGQTRPQFNTNIAPDGWLYVLPKSRVDANLDVRVTSHVTAFLAGRNIFNDRDRQELYGSQTPEYAQHQQENENGILFQIGIKGSF